MGGSQGAAVRLPGLPAEHWHEVALGSGPQRKPSHGAYKLFRNVLTNEQIEQYSLTFQSSGEFERYLQSFHWRNRQEHLVNTRYLDYHEDTTFCGARPTAKVYLEHIPLRLSNIQDIPQPENLYVLLASMAGFEKLYSHIGYFRTNEDMIGIDRQGRVKVWLNCNYSRNYLYGPGYVEGVADPLVGPPEQDEEAMVWEIVKMVEDNTVQENNYPETITQFLEVRRGTLSFYVAKVMVESYAKRYRIALPNYFESILNIFEEQDHMSDEENRSVVVNRPQKQGSKIIHFIDPAEASSQGINSMICMDQPIPPSEQIRPLTHQPLRSAETTGETSMVRPKQFRNFNSIESFSKPTKPRKVEVIGSTVPKINFQYQSQAATVQDEHESIDMDDIDLPMFSTLQDRKGKAGQMGVSERSGMGQWTYSDIHLNYTLDAELAEDIQRYLRE